LFCFSNLPSHGGTTSNYYIKSGNKPASSEYHCGQALQSYPVTAISTDGGGPVRGPATKPVTVQRQRDVHRSTPVLPRQAHRNQQLVEVNLHDDGSTPSSPSFSSYVQTPIGVVSDASNNSSMSDDIRQVLPTAQIPAENQLDLSLENDQRVHHGGHLAHCSSETNLVSERVPLPHGNRSQNTQSTVAADHGRMISAKSTSVSAEYVQQLRRRSRSAENLSRWHRQKADSAAWSSVDIDIGAHTESTVTDRAQQLNVQRQQVKQSVVGQKSVDTLPSPFTTTRLRPFRQQMNSVVVSSGISHKYDDNQ